jgi:predicted branched-subunit amino acid permease
MHKSQPKLKYYLACHFIAVSAWLIMKENYKSVERKYRLDFWIGVGLANLSVAVSATAFGFFIADYLNKDMMIGLAIVNPVYFMCVMVGAMKTIQMSLAVVLGSLLGITFYFVSPEWCILLGGFTAGTLAFFIGELNDT